MSRLDEMNEMLFKQMERLSKTDLTEEQLNVEIERAKAIALVGCQYINSASLQLKQEAFNNTNKRLSARDV